VVYMALERSRPTSRARLPQREAGVEPPEDRLPGAPESTLHGPPGET
jgi:hypothetical protein